MYRVPLSLGAPQSNPPGYHREKIYLDRVRAIPRDRSVFTIFVVVTSGVLEYAAVVYLRWQHFIDARVRTAHPMGFCLEWPYHMLSLVWMQCASSPSTLSFLSPLLAQLKFTLRTKRFPRTTTLP